MKQHFGQNPKGQRRPDTRVQVADLVLVDFRTKNLTPEIQAWKDATPVPYAESCSRQIWYGTREDFANFPFTPEVNRLESAEAYNLLLRIASGYESKRICETHVRHQLYDGFRVFEDNHPERSRDFKSLIKMLKTDLALFDDRIMCDYRTRREEHSVLDLAGQKKGDQVLVIAGETRHGGVNKLTTELAKVCESRQRNYRDFFTYTHPDPKILVEAEKEIRQMQDEGIIRMNIKFIPFDQLPQAIEVNDRIYNAMSMGANPEADAEIIAVWQGRKRDDNTLACLRGNPRLRGNSNPEWNEAGLQNYTSPEDVRSEMLKRHEKNKQVLTRGSLAFQMFSIARENGESPRHSLSDDKMVTIFRTQIS